MKRTHVPKYLAKALMKRDAVERQRKRRWRTLTKYFKPTTDGEVLHYDFDPGAGGATKDTVGRYLVVQKNDDDETCRYTYNSVSDLQRAMADMVAEEGWDIYLVIDLEHDKRLTYTVSVRVHD